MWDLPQSAALGDLIRRMDADGKGRRLDLPRTGRVRRVDSAPTASPFVEGRRVNSFTDQEERKVGARTASWPFLLGEPPARERKGARFSSNAGPVRGLLRSEGTRNPDPGREPSVGESRVGEAVDPCRRGAAVQPTEPQSSRKRSLARREIEAPAGPRPPGIRPGRFAWRFGACRRLRVRFQVMTTPSDTAPAAPVSPYLRWRSRPGPRSCSSSSTGSKASWPAPASFMAATLVAVLVSLKLERRLPLMPLVPACLLSWAAVRRTDPWPWTTRFHSRSSRRWSICCFAAVLFVRAPPPGADF